MATETEGLINGEKKENFVSWPNWFISRILTGEKDFPVADFGKRLLVLFYLFSVKLYLI